MVWETEEVARGTAFVDQPVRFILLPDDCLPELVRLQLVDSNGPRGRYLLLKLHVAVWACAFQLAQFTVATFRTFLSFDKTTTLFFFFRVFGPAGDPLFSIMAILEEDL